MLGGCRLLRVGSGAAEDPHQSFRLIWLSKREGLCWCACGWHAINLQHVATIISLRFYPARGTRAWEQLCGINGVEGDGVPSTQVRTYVLHFMLLTERGKGQSVVKKARLKIDVRKIKKNC